MVTVLFFLAPLNIFSQRNYTENSVLAEGNWYKLKISQEGIYQITPSYLQSLGINTANVNTRSIRLFASIYPLQELNNTNYYDDLEEIAIYMNDGGDNVLGSGDFFLFYSPGSNFWAKDTVLKKYNYVKNIYSDTVCYFLQISSTIGKRIEIASKYTQTAIPTTSFLGKIHYEKEQINLLNSGKEWYGEELSQQPGKLLNISYSQWNEYFIPNTQVQLEAHVAARSLGNSSRFNFFANKQLISTTEILPIGTGQFDDIARAAMVQGSFVSTPTDLFTINFYPGSSQAQGWVNYYSLWGRKALKLSTQEHLCFSDWETYGSNYVQYEINTTLPQCTVWDITLINKPIWVSGDKLENLYKFTYPANSFKEFIAFAPSQYMQPIQGEKIANQNLHKTIPVNYIIISHPFFLTQAQALAAFYTNQKKIFTKVVNAEEIYNEFGCGMQHPTAIRNYLRMYIDKYPQAPLQYVLLFGDASYDYKNHLPNNTSFIPTYQSNQSLQALETFATDDYFGMFSPESNLNNTQTQNFLQIGIGRAPVKTMVEAKAFVTKVINYYSSKSYGDWRNQMLFIADDEDQNLHLNDAEEIATEAESINTELQMKKIYLDLYKQEAGGAGGIYPAANMAITQAINKGLLIGNYTGHGGPYRLAEENILDQKTIESWENENKLPILITASCDFAPFDNPAINSLGENLLLQRPWGAIGLLTTTRLVNANSNKWIHKNYIKELLRKNSNSQWPSLGEALKNAKNITTTQFGELSNTRKFILLGDPALQPAFPKHRIIITKINNRSTSTTDTLKALENIIVSGEIHTRDGILLNQFNGNLYPTIYDKPKTSYTLTNDAGSLPAPVSSYSQILFKGISTIKNGLFEFSFTVPKDINYTYGKGKISLYANNDTADAGGVNNQIVIGGYSENTSTDIEGPQIEVYLNNNNFVNGGLVNSTPKLLVTLTDSAGINTVGNGIGHDIIATIDEDPHNYTILNDYFTYKPNSYTTGNIIFQLPQLSNGLHTLTLKAWDVLNNSAEKKLQFEVANNEKLEIKHVLNYPNPFINYTQIQFEHNQPGKDLITTLTIYTITGKIIKKMTRTINSSTNRSFDLQWDATDEYGQKVARGVYIYKLTVKVAGLGKKEHIEKMVVL